MKDIKNNNHEEAIAQNPEILTRSEAAKYVRMSVRHFQTLVKEGRIPEIRAGQRKRLYRKSAIVSALEESTADEIDSERFYEDGE